MSGFSPIFKASDVRPRSGYTKPREENGFILRTIREQLQFSSLLALGATLVSLVYLAIGRVAFILAPALLLVRIADALLQTYGLRRNPYMDEILMNPTKLSAQYPGSDGSFSGKPADGQVAVFMIGARCNHPLGLLGPGFKDLGDFFDRMVADVEKNAEDYGYLTSQGWVSDQRATGNEYMTVMFFKDAEGIHRYAHGDLHKEGWAWWNKTAAQHSHIGIWHELFVAPKGMWETIYTNSEPLGFGAAQFPVKEGKDGKVMWQSSLVDASRGVLRSSKGRMTMTDGTEHESYDWDMYKGRV